MHPNLALHHAPPTLGLPWGPKGRRLLGDKFYCLWQGTSKMREGRPFLSCRGWKTASAGCAPAPLGDPPPGLHRPSGHYVGCHGCSNTPIVTKLSPKPILGAMEGFHEKSNFKKLSRATKQPIQRENGKVLTAKGPYGGADWGYLDLGPGTHGLHGLGGPNTRKKFFRTQVQIHTQRPQYAKKF